ncbi:MAG: glutamate decarboxylase [Bacillota bacterium]
MWTVVYIMSNRCFAEELKEALIKEGLLAVLRTTDTSNDCQNGPVEILVLESEAEEASQIISKLLSV